VKKAIVEYVSENPYQIEKLHVLYTHGFFMEVYSGNQNSDLYRNPGISSNLRKGKTKQINVTESYYLYVLNFIISFLIGIKYL